MTSFLLSIIAVSIRILTTMLLFNWFASPAFNIKEIGFILAAGLTLGFKLITIPHVGVLITQIEELQKTKGNIFEVITEISFCLVLLAAGWFVHFLYLF